MHDARAGTDADTHAHTHAHPQVRNGVVANETLGYFIGRTYLFLLRAGCKAEHIRFRQHLPDEMAHYAADCWDAEIEMSLGWVECVGIADRSAYDLTCHAKATNTALTASVDLDTPIKVETYQLTKKALAAIGKEFKKDAKVVTGYLTGLDEAGLRQLEADAKAAVRWQLTEAGPPCPVLPWSAVLHTCCLPRYTDPVACLLSFDRARRRSASMARASRSRPI